MIALEVNKNASYRKLTSSTFIRNGCTKMRSKLSKSFITKSNLQLNARQNIVYRAIVKDYLIQNLVKL